MFQAPEDGTVLWRKSTRSAGNGECVEVAVTAARVAVRDSKDPAGPVLRFGPEAWRDFTRALRAEAL